VSEELRLLVLSYLGVCQSHPSHALLGNVQASRTHRKHTHQMWQLQWQPRKQRNGACIAFPGKEVLSARSRQGLGAGGSARGRWPLDCLCAINAKPLVGLRGSRRLQLPLSSVSPFGTSRARCSEAAPS
jgi:hypothetical protein